MGQDVERSKQPFSGWDAWRQPLCPPLWGLSGLREDSTYSCIFSHPYQCWARRSSWRAALGFHQRLLHWVLLASDLSVLVLTLEISEAGLQTLARPMGERDWHRDQLLNWFHLLLGSNNCLAQGTKVDRAETGGKKGDICILLAESCFLLFPCNQGFLKNRLH